jgi:hypothetical protein
MTMTLQEKLQLLEGKVVTIKDHYISSVKSATGKLLVQLTNDPPGSAYISVEGQLGAYLADGNVLISEHNGEILILTGYR